MTNKSRFSVLRKAAWLGGVCVFAVTGLAGSGLHSKAEALEEAGIFNRIQNRNSVMAQSDFGRLPRSDFGRQPQSDFGRQPPSDFGRQPQTDFGRRPPSDFGRQPQGDFRRHPQDEFRRQPRLTNPSRQMPKQPVKGGKPQLADKKAPPPPPGPHVLIISIKSQRITLYANGKNVATSPISSGTETHPTPHGVFSIIQRNRHHRSNIYSGAPMPYMQRLTWSGVALHQGVLPGRPASHGCIRLPESFANFLWNTTKMNTRVIVAREDVEPRDIVHAKLFQPKPVPTTVESPLQDLRKTFDTTKGFVRTAGMQFVITDAALEEQERGESRQSEARPESRPEAEEITARIGTVQPTLQSGPSDEQKPDVVEAKPSEPEAPAGEPGKQEVAVPQPAPQEPAKQEIVAPRPTPAPARSESAKVEPAKIAPPQLASEPAKPEAKPEARLESKPEPKPEAKPEATPEITASTLPQPADIPDAVLASFEKSLAAKAKRVGPTGPLSVFISRKDKRLYVRQAFIPLFSAPVTIKDEAAPFGTHVLTAYGNDDEGKSLRWTAVTMPAEAAIAHKPQFTTRIDARGRKVEVPVKSSKPAETHTGPIPSASSVLDRIDIPQEVVERISYYMTPGSSLILADHGLGYETGLYTDFIVVTKK